MDESLKPLYSELKSVVGVVPKKQVLSVLDTVIALYVVTPLTIAHWRGTWELVEKNRGSFPFWQVFLFASSMYFIFTVARQSFEDIAGCNAKNLPHKVILFLSRRMYTYAFACCSVLHWNSGFNILDNVFETFLGRMHDRPSEVAYFSIACHAILLISRSYRNILTVPFVIALDTRSGTFNFPTRFNTKKTTAFRYLCFKLISNMTTGIVSCAFGARKRPVMKIVIIISASFLLLLTIVYTTVYALRSGETTAKNSTFATPEKLVSIEKQVIEALPARPFINDLRGDSPSSFSQTTPIYPENHRYPGRPNNILDIINYITYNAHRQKQLIKEKFPQDPFFAFKPQDPSDINLLAPNSFRFAPAIVSKPAKKGIKAEGSEMRNSSLTYMKPLKVTLNIYPSQFLLGGENVGFQGPDITPRYRYQQGKNIVTTGKMVVHMNLYPKLTDRNRQIFAQNEYQHSTTGFPSNSRTFFN